MAAAQSSGEGKVARGLHAPARLVKKSGAWRRVGRGSAASFLTSSLSATSDAVSGGGAPKDKRPNNGSALIAAETHTQIGTRTLLIPS